MIKLEIDKPRIGVLTGRHQYIYDVVIELLKFNQELKTFAIYGEWGSGKTSICYNIYQHFNLSLSEKQNNEDSCIIPVWFEAWRFQHEREIFPALIRTIGFKLLEVLDIKNPKIKNFFLKMFKMIKVLTAGVEIGNGIIKFNVKDVYDQLDEELKKDDSNKILKIAQFGASPYFEAYQILKEISTEIKLNNKTIRILLFIDDLDRCLPDVAFKIIEQIKIWIDIDGYTICMALKKSEIEQVVKKYLMTNLNTDDSTSEEMAKDYLLKVISLGIYIDEYSKSLKFDYEKRKIIQSLSSSSPKRMDEIILENIDCCPSEILERLNNSNTSYTFRKLINVANEIYIENLIYKKLNNGK